MYRMITASTADQLKSTFESGYWAAHNPDSCLMYRDRQKGDMFAIRPEGGSVALYERYTGSLGMIKIAEGYEDVAEAVEEIQPDLSKWIVY